MATQAEQLILRGLNLVIRSSFSPNDPEKSARHFISIQQDIGPWLADYAEEIAKPAEDFPSIVLVKDDPGNGGLQQ